MSLKFNSNDNAQSLPSSWDVAAVADLPNLHPDHSTNDCACKVCHIVRIATISLFQNNQLPDGILRKKNPCNGRQEKLSNGRTVLRCHCGPETPCRCRGNCGDECCKWVREWEKNHQVKDGLIESHIWPPLTEEMIERAKAALAAKEAAKSNRTESSKTSPVEQNPTDLYSDTAEYNIVCHEPRNYYINGQTLEYYSSMVEKGSEGKIIPYFPKIDTELWLHDDHDHTSKGNCCICCVHKSWYDAMESTSRLPDKMLRCFRQVYHKCDPGQEDLMGDREKGLLIAAKQQGSFCILSQSPNNPRSMHNQWQAIVKSHESGKMEWPKPLALHLVSYKAREERMREIPDENNPNSLKKALCKQVSEEDDAAAWKHELKLTSYDYIMGDAGDEKSDIHMADAREKSDHHMGDAVEKWAEEQLPRIRNIEGENAAAGPTSGSIPTALPVPDHANLSDITLLVAAPSSHNTRVNRDLVADRSSIILGSTPSVEEDADMPDQYPNPILMPEENETSIATIHVDQTSSTCDASPDQGNEQAMKLDIEDPAHKSSVPEEERNLTEIEGAKYTYMTFGGGWTPAPIHYERLHSHCGPNFDNYREADIDLQSDYDEDETHMGGETTEDPLPEELVAAGAIWREINARSKADADLAEIIGLFGAKNSTTENVFTNAKSIDAGADSTKKAALSPQSNPTQEEPPKKGDGICLAKLHKKQRQSGDRCKLRRGHEEQLSLRIRELEQILCIRDSDIERLRKDRTGSLRIAQLHAEVELNKSEKHNVERELALTKKLLQEATTNPKLPYWIGDLLSTKERYEQEHELRLKAQCELTQIRKGKENKSTAEADEFLSMWEREDPELTTKIQESIERAARSKEILTESAIMTEEDLGASYDYVRSLREHIAEIEKRLKQAEEDRVELVGRNAEIMRSHNEMHSNLQQERADRLADSALSNKHNSELRENLSNTKAELALVQEGLREAKEELSEKENEHKHTLDELRKEKDKAKTISEKKAANEGGVRRRSKSRNVKRYDETACWPVVGFIVCIGVLLWGYSACAGLN